MTFRSSFPYFTRYTQPNVPLPNSSSILIFRHSNSGNCNGGFRLLQRDGSLKLAAVFMRHSQMQFFVTFETFDQILRQDQRSTDPLQLRLVIIDLHDCHIRLVEYNYTGTLILSLKKEDVGFFYKKAKWNKKKIRKKTEKTELK